MRRDQHIIDVWFELHNAMWDKQQVGGAPALRPPALREACYIYVVETQAFKAGVDPQTVEAFVNGLELGAMSALRAAWNPSPLHYEEFLNALKILRAIDEHEFDGFEIDYAAFRDDPYYFLMKADDETANKIWEIIEGRQP
jgi:hypothetical protein